MYDKSTIYQHLIDAKNTGKTCVLATVIAVKGSTSARMGDKAVVENGTISGWIGGGCSQGVVKKVAAQLLEKNERNIIDAKIIRVCPKNEFVASVECYPSQCPSEGSIDILLEAIANDPRILLYGATPIAQSAARHINNLSYRLNWYTEVNDIDVENVEVKQAKQQAKVAIIATQGQGDVIALMHSLSQDIDHVLVICSEKKSAVLLRKLKEQGVSDNQINKVIPHAGLDIGASTPAEIALSVVAQSVLLIRKNTAKIIDASTAKVTVSQKPDLTTNMPVKSSCCGG